MENLPRIRWHKAKGWFQTERYNRCQLSWCGQVLQPTFRNRSTQAGKSWPAPQREVTLRLNPKRQVGPGVWRGNERKTARWERLGKAVGLNPRCTLELPWEKPELFLKMIQRCSDTTPKKFRFHWSGVRTRHRILKFFTCTL